MFENIGYHFSNLNELLQFIDWLSTNFETPEDFESFLLDKIPFLVDADDSYIVFTTIDCAMPMDDVEEPEQSDEQEVSNSFWNLINKEFHQEGSNDTAIPGTD